MKTADVRAKYLEFFKKQGHQIIPSASLVPENDPTTLFTGSGMQPLVPYLLGQKHPLGDRLANSQKSFRSGDIEDVGDNRHTTFFEMLGNWSLGSYFKAEQLPWLFAFLTDEVGIDPKRLYVTAFLGDETNGIPKDTEAADIWKKLFAEKGIEAKDIEIGSEENGYKIGMQGGRIFYYDAKKNWWSRSGTPDKMPAGEPGGPDSEVFYCFEEIEHDTKFGAECHPNCDCGRFLEIGNSVFMEYKRTESGFEKLPQRNVDFGGGLERVAAVSENNSDVFKIDIFKGTIETLEKLSGKSYSDPAFIAAFRVVADHLRSSIFLIGDGVVPSNSERGYFVRRLLRRAVRYWDKLGITEGGLSTLVDLILEFYKDAYPETFSAKETIKQEIEKEETKFRRTLKDGLRQFEKIAVADISGTDAFNLLQSYGFPLELTTELAKERGISVDVESFKEEFKKHQDLSRAGSEKKFKGGLGDTSEATVKLHTAHHLLLKALQIVLGEHVHQRGSNITPERLRIDFMNPEKVTPEKLAEAERIVNEKIAEDLPVIRSEMPREEAEKLHAEHEFGAKYPDVVSVYSVGPKGATKEDPKFSQAYSIEFCGGPHVEHTGVLGTFKIQKEEAVSAGVRRIKAVLE
ncbi:MAG TPA: alanine--tRNA ligase-related protein [Candidatus Paceibacterota bacterium]|nr:alanine--tRNA ligase-related protein [Candidatus Paceibacterota bacterium]